jgi:hypothetical protein
VRCLRLVSVLKAARFACQDEADLQIGVARLLDSLGLQYLREHSLSARDRVDFFLPGGIVLELKVATDGAALLRQVLRYAQHDGVAEIIAASTTHHALALPDTVQGKPLHRVHLMRW